MEPQSINQHPDYHEGFYDAQDGAPLHDYESPEYQAGWRGYWTARGILEGDVHKYDN